MRIFLFLILVQASLASGLKDSPFLSVATFNPHNIGNATNELKLWLEASSFTGADGDPVSTWIDRSGNSNNATQVTATNQPFLKTGVTPNGKSVVRFFGTNYFNVSQILGRTRTNWTVSLIGRLNNTSNNAAFFDTTETNATESILCRIIFLTAGFQLQAACRDDASHQNLAIATNDLQSWKIITATRNGDAIKLRINGRWISTNSAAAIGAMQADPYHTSIGVVHNGSVTPFTSFLRGDIYGIVVYNAATLTETQISNLEAYWTFSTTIPAIDMSKSASNPVVTNGSAGDARILEPTVILDGSTWKMWYSGMTNNGPANLNSNWNTFYATSSDGIAWAKQGIVNPSAWEPDVIKVGSVYYMVHVHNTNYSVRMSTSADGITWTNNGVIIDLTDSTWSNIGPREPCLYNEGTSWYCYYADAATSGGKYKIGLSVCTNDPIYHTNWICQTTPLFSATSTSPRWNEGGDTESPCVRKYSWLPHPYLMSFTGFSPFVQGAELVKPWREGLAVADSPLGPWTEGRYDALMTSGTGWDDWVVAEMSHLTDSGNMYFYYSGARKTFSNQVGVATISTNNIKKWLQW